MGYKENFLPYQRAHAFTIIARRASRLSAELLCEQYSNATLPGDRNSTVVEPRGTDADLTRIQRGDRQKLARFQHGSSEKEG